MTYCEYCNREVDALEAHIAERHQCPRCGDVVDFVPAHIHQHHTCPYCQVVVDNFIHHLMGYQNELKSGTREWDLINDYLRSEQDQGRLGTDGELETLAQADGFPDSHIGDFFNHLVQARYVVQVRGSSHFEYKFLYDQVCQLWRESIPDSDSGNDGRENNSKSEEHDDSKEEEKEEEIGDFPSPDRNFIKNPALRNIQPPSSNEARVLQGRRDKLREGAGVTRSGESEPGYINDLDNTYDEDRHVQGSLASIPIISKSAPMAHIVHHHGHMTDRRLDQFGNSESEDENKDSSDKDSEDDEE